MGGAENISINLANSLANDYKVTIISLFNEQGKPFFHIDSKCKHVVISEKTKSITKNIYSLQKEVRAVLKEQNVDVLLSITAGIVTVGALAVRGTKAKHIYCEHSNLENQTYGKKHLLRQYIGAKLSNKIVVLTNRDKNNYINKFKIKNSKIDVIPNYFDAKKYDINYNKESKIIVSLGRLKSVKGFDRAIEIAKEVYKKHPDWQWHIYGEGDERQNLEKKIEQYKLENFFILKGATTQVQETLSTCSFFVMTSYYEGIPLALLEAQSVGLPTVAFNCPTGPEEVIADGINGALVENNNMPQMIDTINKFIEDENLRTTYSSNSMINFNKFSKKTILQQWKNLIDEI